MTDIPIFHFLNTYFMFCLSLEVLITLLSSTTLTPYQAPSISTKVTRERGHFLAQTHDECYQLII